MGITLVIILIATLTISASVFDAKPFSNGTVTFDDEVFGSECDSKESSPKLDQLPWGFRLVDSFGRSVEIPP